MLAEKNGSRSRGLYIRRIEVEDLFGQYTYELEPQGQDDLSRLLILYGENGSGKTTLLWLVFHLLSREPKKGHRTFLAHHRFKKLAVQFGDDSKIVAQRTQTVIGSFAMSYARGSEYFSFNYEVNDRGAIGNLSDDKEHSIFERALPDISLKFLADDRKISTELDLEEERDATSLYWDKSLIEQTNRIRLKGDVSQILSAPPRWETALTRVLQWVRERAIGASNQGQLDFNAIYSQLIESVGRPTAEEASKLDTEVLIRALKDQAHRNHDYAKFGLTSELDVSSLVNSISRVDKRRLAVIGQILHPYIEGNEARLRALGSLQQSIQTFVSSINDFFVNKRVTFNIGEGLRIHSQTGESLEPAVLSSGEKQLLILFCNIVSASDKATIFIIDEPEISLNVSWQRRLLDAMVRCVGDNQVQFFFATHSLELTSRHMDKVARLVNKQVPQQQPASPVVSSSVTEEA